jgi:hypothetical protein
MVRSLLISVLFAPLLVVGCGPKAQDSHTEVFQTAQQGAAERLARQLQAHKELAVSVLRFSRPDVTAKPADGTSITVSADGVTRAIDLAPIEDQLLHHENEQRAIVRKYLDEQMRPFDFERLKGMGFGKVQKQVAFALVNDRTLAEMQKQAGDSPLLQSKVVTNLYRVTVVRREQPAAVTVPLTAALAEAWRTPAEQVDAAATQNLRESLATAGDNLVETLAFGPRGKSGSLKSGVDPAVILSPEFLKAVQGAWKSTDNLVLFAPSGTGITFVEEHNAGLLELLVPQWKKILVSTPNPLSDQLLLRDGEKLSVYAYTPATKPSTKPAATKPAPYIVH